MNLYYETLDALERNGKTESDIDYFNLMDGGSNHPYNFSHEYYTVDTLREFKKYASTYSDYNNGYGLQVVPPIFVVFKDGSWLSRWEYDGSEGWEYNEKPKRIKDAE